MSIQKTGESVKFEVIQGEEAKVLDEHRERLGKTKVSDFTADEVQALEEDLDRTRNAPDS